MDRRVSAVTASGSAAGSVNDSTIHHSLNTGRDFSDDPFKDPETPSTTTQHSSHAHLQGKLPPITVPIGKLQARETSILTTTTNSKATSTNQRNQPTKSVLSNKTAASTLSSGYGQSSKRTLPMSVSATESDDDPFRDEFEFSYDWWNDSNAFREAQIYSERTSSLSEPFTQAPRKRFTECSITEDQWAEMFMKDYESRMVSTLRFLSTTATRAILVTIVALTALWAFITLTTRGGASPYSLSGHFITCLAFDVWVLVSVFSCTVVKAGVRKRGEIIQGKWENLRKKRKEFRKQRRTGHQPKMDSDVMSHKATLLSGNIKKTSQEPLKRAVISIEAINTETAEDGETDHSLLTRMFPCVDWSQLAPSSLGLVYARIAIWCLLAIGIEWMVFEILLTLFATSRLIYVFQPLVQWCLFTMVVFEVIECGSDKPINAKFFNSFWIAFLNVLSFQILKYAITGVDFAAMKISTVAGGLFLNMLVVAVANNIMLNLPEMRVFGGSVLRSLTPAADRVVDILTRMFGQRTQTQSYIEEGHLCDSCPTTSDATMLTLACLSMNAALLASFGGRLYTVLVPTNSAFIIICIVSVFFRYILMAFNTQRAVWFATHQGQCHLYDGFLASFVSPSSLARMRLRKVVPLLPFEELLATKKMLESEGPTLRAKVSSPEENAVAAIMLREVLGNGNATVDEEAPMDEYVPLLKEIRPQRNSIASRLHSRVASGFGGFGRQSQIVNMDNSDTVGEVAEIGTEPSKPATTQPDQKLIKTLIEKRQYTAQRMKELAVSHMSLAIGSQAASLCATFVAMLGYTSITGNLDNVTTWYSPTALQGTDVTWATILARGAALWLFELIVGSMAVFFVFSPLGIMYGSAQPFLFSVNYESEEIEGIVRGWDPRNFVASTSDMLMAVGATTFALGCFISSLGGFL